MTEIKNTTDKIKSLLALAGDVWLSESDIGNKLKDSKLSPSEISKGLSRLYNENEIVMHNNTYAINCHQYM